MSGYINHITLQTGHIRRSEVSEISSDAIAFCQDLITDCLVNQGEKIPIQNFDGYFFSAGNLSGKSLFGTVWKHDIPLVTLIVATKSRSSQKLWSELHRHATQPAVTNPLDPPSVPWIAASLTSVAASADIEAMQWLGDFERCIAWAWVQYE